MSFVRVNRVSAFGAALLALVSVLAFSPGAARAAGGRTPEQIAEANREKAQKIADKALQSIDKTLSKGSLGLEKVADAVIRNLDRLFSRNVRDLAKYQAEVGKAATKINRDGIRSLATAARQITSTTRQLEKLNQPLVLAAFVRDANQKVADFALPQGEALARIQARLQEIAAELAP